MIKPIGLLTTVTLITSVISSGAGIVLGILDLKDKKQYRQKKLSIMKNMTYKKAHGSDELDSEGEDASNDE